MGEEESDNLIVGLAAGQIATFTSNLFDHQIAPLPNIFKVRPRPAR
jgi:hypothetical protein